MHDALQMATISLSEFLDENLPKLSCDWWSKNVLAVLSTQQRRIALERGFSSVSEFDLSALLRIFDMNYFEISSELKLPREGRIWIKELQSVRNKWAHLSTNPPPAEDIFRDADTLERLLALIRADEEVLDVVWAAKSEALSKMTDGSEKKMTFTGMTEGAGGLRRMNRPMIRKDWVGRGITLVISIGGNTYTLPHDELLEWVSTNLNALNAKSWIVGGIYSWPAITKKMHEFLEYYE